MSDTILTEAMALQATRNMIDSAVKRIEAQAWEMEGRERMNAGRLIEALEVAEGAIFNALNVAASRCQCSDAHAAIEFGLGRIRIELDTDDAEPKSLRA